MPCQLRIRDDLSVADIARLAQSHVVRRTPHVGNLPPPQTALPALGVELLVVDCTIPDRDALNRPDLFIRGGNAQHLCADVSRMTTHLTTTHPQACNGHGSPRSLADVHVGALRQLYPRGKIRTCGEHLAAHSEAILRILAVVARGHPGFVWWRRVDSAGAVYTCSKRETSSISWEQVYHRVFQLTDTHEGMLLHNRFLILMDIIEQSQYGAEPDINHLSGPAMAG